MKWLNLVKQFAPLVLAFAVPHGADLAPYVSLGIAEAEAIKGASGPDKLAHALAIVRAGVAGANSAAGRTVLDPASVDASIEAAVSTVVNVANLVHQAKAK